MMSDTEQLQRALELLSEMISTSTQAMKAVDLPATDSFKSFGESLKTLMERNASLVGVLPEDLDSIAESLSCRLGEYIGEVEHYVNDSLKGHLKAIDEELKEYGIRFEPCRKAFRKVRDIVRRFMISVFVRGEKAGFSHTISVMLNAAEWEHEVKMPYLRELRQEEYLLYLDLLQRQLHALRSHYVSHRRHIPASVYPRALAELFDAMLTTVAAARSELAVDRAEEDSWPQHIFVSPAAWSWFRNMHTEFCSSARDLGYLFRIMSGDHRIIARDTVFKDWYTAWEHSRFEVDSFFKTLDRLVSTGRTHRFSAATARLSTPAAARLSST